MMKLRTSLLTFALALSIAGVAAAQVVEAAKTTPATATPLATASAQLTVTGKVVSSTSTELMIDNDAGQRMTFALDAKTTPATTFTAGERVTVQYQTSTSGTVFQAANIVVDPSFKLEPQASAMPAPMSAPAHLPKTASGLPGVGLLGLIALGGAIVVRVLRS